MEGDEDELDCEQEPERRVEASVDSDTIPKWCDSRRVYGQEPDPDLEEEDGTENQVAGGERMPDQLRRDEPIEPLDLAYRRAREKIDGASSG